MIDTQELLRLEESLNQTVVNGAPCHAKSTVFSACQPLCSQTMADYTGAIEEFLTQTTRKESFTDILYKLIDENGYQNDADFYKYARIPKSTYSNMRTNERCSIDTVFKIAVALKLPENKLNLLLETARQKPNPNSKKEMILLFCIQNQIYDIELVYEILTYFGVDDFYKDLLDGTGKDEE